MAQPGVEITWFGQAGFALRAAGRTVLVDAFLTDLPERMYPPPADPATFGDVDVILATHEHRDHLDLPTVKLIVAASPQSVVVVPEPIVGHVHAAGIDPTRVIGARDHAAVEGLPDGVSVHALPAEHGVHVADSYNFGRAEVGAPSRYLGYVVEIGAVKVFHGGDTLWWEGMEEALRACGVQVALLSVNGRDRARETDDDTVGNMDGREAAVMATRAGVDLLVPMHWDAWRGNLGFPDQVVQAVVHLDLDLTVLVPRRMRPFRYAPA